MSRGGGNDGAIGQMPGGQAGILGKAAGGSLVGVGAQIGSQGSRGQPLFGVIVLPGQQGRAQSGAVVRRGRGDVKVLEGGCRQDLAIADRIQRAAAAQHQVGGWARGVQPGQ